MTKVVVSSLAASSAAACSANVTSRTWALSSGEVYAGGSSGGGIGSSIAMSATVTFNASDRPPAWKVVAIFDWIFDKSAKSIASGSTIGIGLGVVEAVVV